MEKHNFVEDDIMAREHINGTEQITYHRIIFKLVDMLDICLLVVFILLTIKFMKWIL